MTAVFLVGVLGMDSLLPKSLAEHSVAARVLLHPADNVHVLGRQG